jgi:F-type H+-transporting ATPase subunit epsilon
MWYSAGMQVTIAKVHENLFSGDAQSVTLPTVSGEVTVLAKHEPMVTTLLPGTVTVKAHDGAHTFAVTGGVLEVSSDQVTVLL